MEELGPTMDINRKNNPAENFSGCHHINITATNNRSAVHVAVDEAGGGGFFERERRTRSTGQHVIIMPASATAVVVGIDCGEDLTEPLHVAAHHKGADARGVAKAHVDVENRAEGFRRRAIGRVCHRGVVESESRSSS